MHSFVNDEIKILKYRCRFTGMPWMVRKMASKATPEMDIVQTGNNFKITMKTLVFTNVMEFNAGGEEFLFEPPKGPALKVLFQKLNCICDILFTLYYIV